MKTSNLILKINSSLDTNYKKDINEGISSVNANLLSLIELKGKLKNISLDIINYEKTATSINKVKIKQDTLNESIDRYQNLLKTAKDKESKSYIKTTIKLQSLNKEYKNNENHLSNLEDKEKRLTNQLKKKLNVLDKVTAKNKMKDFSENIIKKGSTVAMSQVKKFYLDSISLAQQQIKSEITLTDMLEKNKNLKGNSNRIENAKKDLTNNASQLQKTGVIGEELIISGQSQLATYQFQPNTIKTLSSGMLDMMIKNKGIEATQADVVNTADLLGNAMNGNFGELKKYGVILSEEQEEVLKFGIEQQKAATLAKILEKNYGGANKKLAETPIGVIKNFQNAWKNMQKEVGKEILPQLSNLCGYLKTNLPDIQNGIISITRGLMNGSKLLITNRKLVIGLGKAYLTFKGIQLMTQGVQKGIDLWKSAKTIPLKYKEMVANKGLTLSELANKGALIASSVATKAYTAAQWLMNAAMTANPIGLVIAGIAGLGVGLVFAYKKSEQFRNIINGTWEKVKEFWKSLDNNPFTKVAKKIVTIVNPIFLLWKGINKIKGLWDKFRGKDEKSIVTTDIVTNEKSNTLTNSRIPNSYGNYVHNMGNIPKYETDGLISKPQIDMVGEGGAKEKIIPINSSNRSKSLFLQTGKVLGVNQLSTRPSIKNMPVSIGNFINKPLFEIEIPKIDFLDKMTQFLSSTKEKIINNITSTETPIKVDININIQGDISAEKAREVGQRVGRGLEDELNQLKKKGGRLAFG